MVVKEVFNKIADFTPASLQKNIAVIFLCAEELHCRTTNKTAFCSTPSFVKNQSRTASKAKNMK